jgi:signal transduction histidine kinase
MARHRGCGPISAALVAAAVVIYFVADSQLVDNVCYLGVLVGASASAWWGAQRAPAERRLFGRLIAVGISLTALGDGVWETLDAMGRANDVSVADPLWFASYLVLCAALLVVLRRSGAGRHDLDFTLDAVTLVVVIVLFLWSAAVDTIVRDPTLPVHARVVWASYPIADALLLALVVRVLTSRVARTSLSPVFAVGATLWLAADLAYLGAPEGAVANLMDAAWMVAPALMAYSVWRLRSFRPVPPSATPGRRRPVSRLAVAVAPLLVPPVLEFLAHLRGQSHLPFTLLAGTTILTLLAFVRMARLVRSEEHALRQLEDARDAALEASRSKSRFLATVSHELRTPLTMVLGSSEILQDTDLDDVQRDLARSIRRSGQRLGALVDDILDFSRLEVGQLQVSAVPFRLAEVVGGVAEACRPRAEAVGLELECVLDPGLPDTLVGDPERVAQVLGHLVGNAVKFSHEGLVRLAVRQAPDGESRVDFVVTDTGIGIADEHLESVFDSFEQVDGSTTRHYGGLGLGLAVCRGLVDLMGGTLVVSSRVGVGSEFVARIPVVSEAGPSDGRAERSMAHLGASG